MGNILNDIIKATNLRRPIMECIYFAGGCLWGVQAFMKTLPGVVKTEAGRANGTSDNLDGPYDGYAECVRACKIICVKLNLI
jgi:peptide methionine sulfoxide reductase MsrA